MFKFVPLFALLALASARPWTSDSNSVVYSSPLVQEHGYAKIGSVVKSVPTAVSHQSSTVVHNSAEYVEPIVAKVVKTYAAAPVLKTYAVPAPLTVSAPLEYTLKAYTGNTINKRPVQNYAAPAPLLLSAPLQYTLKAYTGNTINKAPVQTYSAPLLLSASAPYSYSAPAPISLPAPLSYASGWY